jgi:hypothetical protein
MSTVTKPNQKSVYTLADLGITPEEAAEYCKLADVPEEVFQQAMAEGRTNTRDGDPLSQEALWKSIRKLRRTGAGSGQRTPPSRLVCETSTIKRTRRTKAKIEALENALLEIVAEEEQPTVRWVFYRAVSAGVIPKTEPAYKQIVCRLLGKMRKDGRLPYDALADGTRWRMKPRSYRSLSAAMNRMQEDYRRELWANQRDYVEIWTEKDSIASIVYSVTSQWDVPLMVARGYPSLSFLYSCAADLTAIRKPAYLYYFGDHDPSGKDSRRFVEQTIREMAPTVQVTFRTIAVTPEQIVSWKLPTRPTKKTDTRAKHFKGRSVEIDAIAPSRLRQLVESCIVHHIDAKRLASMRRVETAERETLQGIVRRLAGDGKEGPGE